MVTTEERMQILEKQVRRQRRWNLALGAVIIAGGLMAATSQRTVPEIIQAKSFEVVDDKGNALVLLAPNPFGHGSVTVNKKSRGFGPGETIAVVSSDDLGNGGIDAYSRDGKTVIASLGADPRGDGAVAVFSKRGKQVFQASPDDAGDGTVNLFNRDGKTMIAGVGADPDGNGAVSVFTKGGKQVFQVSSDQLGDGVLSIMSRHGKVVVSLEVDEQGGGVVGTLDKNGALTGLIP
jgi:hypothetical protein